MLPSIMAQPPYVVIPIEPTFRITDWNGRAIEAAQSRGNVVAVADFSDNLMRLESALWPTAARFSRSYAVTRDTKKRLMGRQGNC